ncbi:serine/threonine protein kinase [Corallococcus exiguus]|uniref:serine/threonine-protein kinase n=1 Tax=Corallococcus TaxID=83461 RepID=UPI000EA168B7|nr:MULTISPECIES: serine/threonine-protein kinase [Corallococcus]NNC17562.1 serine/threonine protein kinase [Corallococcus exiguus]RKH24271.1 serine/threonine protein kinase [Corallococcus sp. CA041A]
MIVTTKLRFIQSHNLPNQGQNSRVFLAHDPQLKADLVIKEIPKSQITDPDEYFSESAILYDARHPNVVEVKYACEDEDNIYLAMPQYAESLQGLMASRFLTVQEIVQIGLGFLTGLHHIHTKKLIHFDIKPANILLDKSRHPALSDFGLTRFLNSNGLATPANLYDKIFPPEYMTKSNALSLAADIYQAGLTLYRMCNGNTDFETQFNAHKPNWMDAIIDGNFPDRGKFLPHIPKRLRKLIKKALSIDQASRFHTALELSNELAQVEEYLDWTYTPTAGNGASWYRRGEGCVFQVSLKKSGSQYSIESSRINTATSTKRKVTAGTFLNVNQVDVEASVQTALTACS